MLLLFKFSISKYFQNFSSAHNNNTKSQQIPFKSPTPTKYNLNTQRGVKVSSQTVQKTFNAAKHNAEKERRLPSGRAEMV